MADFSFTSPTPQTTDHERVILAKLFDGVAGIGSASGLLAGTAIRQPVLTRCGGPINARYNSATSWTTRTKHYVRADCSSLKLVYPAKYASAGSTPEDTLTNSVTVKAAIETSGGVVIPVYFSGSRTGTLADGATLESDAVGLSLSSGDYVWLRCYHDKGASTYHFSNVIVRGASAVSGEGYDASDKVDSGTISQSDYVGLIPILVSGEVEVMKTNGVLIVGDSMTVGDNDFSEVRGFMERAFSSYYPSVTLGVGGEKASTFKSALSRLYRMTAAQKARYRVAICEYGSNDWAAGDSAATIMANLTLIHTALRSMGLRVYQTTIPPRPTSSSNNWTTVAGQTAAATDAARVSLNALIRAIPTPLAGYLEVADPVESARDSGKWYCPSAVSYSGTSAGTTSGVAVTPSGSPGWTVNQWAGYICRNATAGTVKLIRSNTAGVLTCESAHAFTAGDTVEIWGSFTTDGVHPSPLAHAAAARQFALSVL